MARTSLLLRLLLITLLATTTPLFSSAQSKNVDEQRRRVNQYKRDLESAKKEVDNLKKEKSSASRRLSALEGQMRSRSNYIAEIERERQIVIEEIELADACIDSLGGELQNNRDIYAEVVRTAYRNHQQNNNLTYLFSSSNLSDA